MGSRFAVAVALLMLATPAWAGASRSFNGASDILVADADSLSGSAVTVSAWVRHSGVSVNRVLIGKWGAGTEYVLIISTASAGKYQFGVNAGTVDSITGITDGLNDGAWHYVTGTFDGTTLAVYVDGALDNSKAKSGTIANTTQDIYLGVYGSSGGDFTGSVAYASVWTRALTLAEIQTEMRCPGSIVSSRGLALSLLDEGGTLKDLSGNGNDGTNNATTASTDGPPVTFCGRG